MANIKKESDFLNRIKQSIYQRRTYWIGFLLLLVTYVAVYIMKGIYPFGGNAILGDSHAQCLPFMSELHRKLLSHESLQYSWAGSMGMDFISIIAYYLSSPLSFYYIFFSGRALYGVAAISTILKALLAYTTMYYYLVKRPDGEKNSNSMELVLFSGAYTLNNLFISFELFYPFQDVMIMLPLVMLGLEQFVAGKGRKLYFISLIIMILCNYYLGAMACLFIVLYYFTLSFGSFKKFIMTSVRVLYTSLLAVGCTAVLLVPVIMALQQDSANISEFLGVGFFGNWFDVLQNLYFLSTPILNVSNTFMYSKVNLYMGMLVTLLALCYFFNRNTPWQIRIRKIVLFGVLILSLNESLANYIMQFFHYTNGIPNRQMLFLLFLCIGMGQNSFAALKKDSKSINKICMSVVLLAMLALICFSVLYVEELGTIVMYIGTFGTIVVYGIFLLLQKRFDHPENFVRVLVVLGVLEMVAGTVYSYHKINTSEIKRLFSNYETVSSIAKELSENNSFCHIVKNNTYEQPNIGSLGGYHGIEAFSSVLSSDYVNVLTKLGNNSVYNQVLDYTHTPFLNSLLNVKYIISNEGEEQGGQSVKEPMSLYEEYKTFDDYTVYENKTVLSPILVSYGDFDQFEKEIADYEENEAVDAATIQNSLLQTLCKEGSVNDILIDTELKIDEVRTDNCFAQMINGTTLVINNTVGSNENLDQMYDPGKNSMVTVVFTAKEDGELYYLREQRLRHFGEVKKGGQYSFDINVTTAQLNSSGICQMQFAYKLYNNDVWKQAYNQLSGQQMEITSYTDSSLEGYLSSDDTHTVFTSIPYDKNWKVYIDGKRVETSAIADAFLSFTIDKGEHQVRMVYSNPYIFVGILISLLCVLISFVIWQHNRKRAGVTNDL